MAPTADTASTAAEGKGRGGRWGWWACGGALACVCALLAARWTGVDRSAPGGSEAHAADWRTDPAAEAALGGSGCDARVARRHWRDLSEDTFRRVYVAGQRPVLIQGLQENWTAAVHWRRPQLLQRYGSNLTRSGTGSDIVYGGGDGAAVVTLRQYVEQWSGEDAQKAYSALDADAQDMFTFDVDFLKSCPDMRQDFQVAPYFRFFDNPQNEKVQYSWHILSLGASRSGLPFHVHGETWLGLVHGRKKWYLYPPGEGPPREIMQSFNWLKSVWQWTQELMPRIPSEHAPIECVQEPGEVMYLPSMWKHMTVNLGDAIAVGGQAALPAKDRLALSLAALAKDPDDYEGHHGAALAYTHLGFERQHEGTLRKAITHFEQAAAVKKESPEIHCLLAELYYYLADRPAMERVLTSARDMYLAMEREQSRLSKRTVSRWALASAILKLGRIHLLAKDPNGALPYLQTALDINADYHEAKYDRAIAYDMLGRGPECIAQLEHIVEVAPHDTRSRDALAYFRDKYLAEPTTASSDAPGK